MSADSRVVSLDERRLQNAKRRIREAIADLDALQVEGATAHLLGAFAAIKKHELGIKP